MSCKDCQRQLTRARRPQELSRESRVQAHLAACPRCREAYQAQFELVRQLASLAGAQAPAHLETGIMAEVYASRLQPWFRSLRLRLAAAATALVAVAVGLTLYLGTGSQPAPVTADNRDLQPMVQAYAQYRASGVTGDSGMGLMQEAEGLF